MDYSGLTGLPGVLDSSMPFDVAASVFAIAIGICMGLLCLALLAVLKLADWFGGLKGGLDSSLSADGVCEAPEVGVGEPAPEPAPDPAPVESAVATSPAPTGPTPTGGEWVAPPAPGGLCSPWSGTLVASGRLVDTSRLAVLYPVIPTAWMN